jgi:hypothetical protein
MMRFLYAGLAGLTWAAATAAPAAAGGYSPPAPIPQRVALSEVVVVGKVTGFADKTVAVPKAPGEAATVEYQVAIVRVDDPILGAKGVKEVKVGFVPPAAREDGPPDTPRRGPGGGLAVDQEALFFLIPHPDGPFYIPVGFYDVIDKSDRAFEKSVEEAKRCAKLLADPKAGLTAKSAEDRFLTAALLVARCRAQRIGVPVARTEAIDAEESKLVLQTLADADWDLQVRSAASALAVNPEATFVQLDLREADDWKRPEDFDAFPAAARKWLKEHAEKYRLRRNVFEKKDDKKEDKKDGK